MLVRCCIFRRRWNTSSHSEQRRLGAKLKKWKEPRRGVAWIFQNSKVVILILKEAGIERPKAVHCAEVILSKNIGLFAFTNSPAWETQFHHFFFFFFGGSGTSSYSMSSFYSPLTGIVTDFIIFSAIFNLKTAFHFAATNNLNLPTILIQCVLTPFRLNKQMSPPESISLPSFPPAFILKIVLPNSSFPSLSPNSPSHPDLHHRLDAKRPFPPRKTPVLIFPNWRFILHRYSSMIVTSPWVTRPRVSLSRWKIL